MKIVVEIMAEAITNKLTKLAVCKMNIDRIDENYLSFSIKTSIENEMAFLPPEIHPDMESGMGMATNRYLGTDSSWLKVEIMQIMLEQVRK